MNQKSVKLLTLILRLAAWLTAVAFLANPARAHGPFDHSAQLLVNDAHLEFVVTMGADATSAFLAGAGLPPTIATEIMGRTTAQPSYELPQTLAARLAEVTVDGKPIEADTVKVVSSGLEAHFMAIYLRPDAGVLKVRALYFNGIESMKGGAFVAHDDLNQTLTTALWSRANNSVEFTLPAKPTVNRTVTANELPPAVALPQSLPPESESRAGLSLAAFVPLLTLLVMAVCGLLTAWLIRRNASSP